MEDLDINYILNYYHRRLNGVKTTFRRYLYDKVNWNSHLVGLMGMRGVGKTTMLLQRLLSEHADINGALYASLDTLWFKTHTLSQLAEYADMNGIKYLYLDEVHRYPNWAIEIKAITDLYPEMKIVYTGSSMLVIDHSKADLSRRQTLYHLSGMSFREFLALAYGIVIEPLTLGELLTNHVAIALDITSRIKIMPCFNAYLRYGYYPFFKDAQEDYLIRLNEVVNTIIDVDLPSVEPVKQETIDKAKKLLMVLSENVPNIVKMSTLFAQIETTRDQGLKLLNLLERGGLLMMLSHKTKNYKRLMSPEKIYLQNSNLMHAISNDSDVGSIRETFFLNQLQAVGKISMPPQGDFLVNDRFLFEVGGKGKTFDQIADHPDNYLAVDNTEIGHGHRIPLWMFGLLY